MDRYLNSLLITSIFAVVLSILVFALIGNSVVKPKVKKESIVKIHVVKSKPKQTVPQVKQKPMIEPKQIQVPKPMPKPITMPKPVSQPIVAPQPVAVVTPTPRSVPIVETKPVSVPQPVVTPKPEPIREVSSRAGELGGFISGLKSTINAKKKYPNEAIRDKIQGSVHMIFDIESDGSVSNVRISGGDILLRNAAKKSLLASCPMRIPAGLSGSFPIKDISTDVVFKLQ